MKQCSYIVVYRLFPIFVEIEGVKMLTLFSGLYCFGFMSPIGVVVLVVVSGNRD
jgi:hypothetical protein